MIPAISTNQSLKREQPDIYEQVFETSWKKVSFRIATQVTVPAANRSRVEAACFRCMLNREFKSGNVAFFSLNNPHLNAVASSDLHGFQSQLMCNV